MRLREHPSIIKGLFVPSSDIVIRADKFILDPIARDLLLPDGSIIYAIPSKPTLILEALMIKSPRFLTREDLLDYADIDVGATDRTIDVYIRELRKRIESEKPPRHIITRVGLGYAFKP